MTTAPQCLPWTIPRPSHQVTTEIREWFSCAVSTTIIYTVVFRVRLQSQKTYSGGLFIADIVAMPYGCSVWPAYWSVGPDWPAAGIHF